MDYARYEYYLSATLLICAMFGMGTTLRPRDFLAVARAPQGIALIVLVQLLVTPCLALLLAWLFRLPREIAVGMLVYAALPGGLFSNVITYVGRGNVALSVSATSVCSLACLVTTTLVLKTFGATQLPPDFAMPVGHILAEIGLCLLLPLLLGMTYRRLFPAGYATVAKVCVRASLVMLGLIIIAALSSGRIPLATYGWRSLLAFVLAQVVLVWLCHGLGWLLRLSLRDTFTAAVEVVMRNSHLGVLLKAALFPAVAGGDNRLGDGVLFVVLVAGAFSLVIGISETIGIRRRWGVYRALAPDEP